MKPGVRLAVTSGALGFVLGALLAGSVGTWWGRRADTVTSDASTLQTVEGAPMMTEAAPDAPAAMRAEPVADLVDRRLAVPVLGVGRDTLRASFDETRGDSRRHEAIDILAPTGTPVLAVEDGPIARLFMSDAGGVTIYQLDPTGRYAYYYAHLDADAPALRDGDTVTRGQIIGFVAIFELTEAKRWWQGTPIDPYPILR